MQVNQRTCEESARFCDELVVLPKEEPLQSALDDIGKDGEVEASFVEAWEATTDVDNIHWETSLFAEVHDLRDSFESVVVHLGVEAARADVERDTDDWDLEFGCQCQEMESNFFVASVLVGERALGVVSDSLDPEEELALWVEAVDFEEFFFAVEDGEVDVDFLGVKDVLIELHWVGEDDLVWFGTALEDQFDLFFGSAVEVGAESDHLFND